MRRNDAQSALGRRPSGESRLRVALEDHRDKPRTDANWGVANVEDISLMIEIVGRRSGGDAMTVGGEDTAPSMVAAAFGRAAGAG